MRPRAQLWLALVAALCLAPGLAFAVPTPTTTPTTTTTTTTIAAPAKTAVDQDIRDIRGPVSIPLWWGWRWLALGGAGLIFATATLLITRRRRAPLTPRQRALQRLHDAMKLAQSGHAREYAIAASAAIREYIETQFGLHAESATTEEFFEALVAPADSPLGEHQAALTHFLAACDLAKFACFQLAAAEMETLDELARSVVLQTSAPKPAVIQSTRMS